jgi:hypothetical protein
MASEATTRPGLLVIDCATCPARELHCADCMVTALGRLPEPGVPLDVDERTVVTTLVRAGMLSAEAAATVRARRVPGERVGTEGERRAAG